MIFVLFVNTQATTSRFCFLFLFLNHFYSQHATWQHMIPFIMLS